MKLVATKTFSYAGNRLAIGEVFETKTERDAKLLVGVYKARPVEERIETKIEAPKAALIERLNKNKIVTEEPKEEPKEVVAPVKAKPNTRRTYNRKN